MKQPLYLTRSRHGIYYFRWPLPYGEGDKPTTVRVSLGTRCPDRAGILARYLASCGELTGDNDTLARIRQDKLRDMVKAFFQAQLSQYLEWINNRGLPPKVVTYAREEMLDHEVTLDDPTIDQTWPNYLPVARFKNKMGISDAEWAASQPNATIELRKGRRDMLKMVLEAVERLESYSLGEGSAVLPFSAPEPPEIASISLGQAIDDYMAEKSRELPDTTQKQFRAYLALLEEYFGRDRSLTAIDRNDASKMKQVLLALPVNRNTKPELKGLSLAELVELKGVKTLSSKTINSHIDMYARFFDWAERHGHCSMVLFKGMKVQAQKAPDAERKAFTKEQVARLYTELTENTSGLVRKDSHKWATLLGLFTGARLNEIAQLDIKDIQQEGDIWFLDINDEGNPKKSLKARASKRKLPLHSTLIRLGFPAFVASRSSGKRLFPDYQYNAKMKYGRSLSRWFNDTFLAQLGMKEPGVVFHSLRHTVATQLGQSSIEEPVIRAVLGHSQEGTTQNNYMKGYTLEQLRDALEHFTVEKPGS